MSKPKLEAKKIVRALFKKGYLLTEIIKHPKILEVNDGQPIARSSAYLYTKDIALPDSILRQKSDKRNRARQKNAKKGRDSSAEKALNKRMLYQSEGAQLFHSDEKFKILCAIYWGEGYKSRIHCGITNSDADMLCFLSQWLDSIEVPWTFRVHYYKENGFTETQIKDYWQSVIPNLENSKFRKFHKKTKSKNRPNATDTQKPINKHPYGLGVVLASSVYARQLVEGGILELKKLKASPYLTS